MRDFVEAMLFLILIMFSNLLEIYSFNLEREKKSLSYHFLLIILKNAKFWDLFNFKTKKSVNLYLLWVS